ncbi:MAG: Na(+)/phosphate symporter [Halioglobus sp.]|nr:Na(+)/phosphate symporter [Halioglobus sp.]
METVQILVAGVTAVILFVFGLENFSREIEQISGERFRRTLAHATRFPVVGFIIGALVTAVIQSSSATSVIAIGLVNAGVLSFKNSVGIVFGANVGTTVTAQLVAFKLTAFAPVFIIAGFALSLLRSRASIFGKSIFYFGFVFFSLNLISSSLQPLQNEPGLMQYLVQPQHPLLALLVGCAFTALVQSSSVTTGLAIIFTQQGLMGLENAVPIIMGANIGTTATALIAMLNMDAAAKKTALSHFLFNVGGVLIFLPAVLSWSDQLHRLGDSPAVALANFHLIFNLAASALFLLLITPFTRLVEALIGEGKMDFQRLDIPVYQPEEAFDEVHARLEQNLRDLLAFLQENYNQVTLSIESNYRNVLDSSAKRIDYINFIEKEYLAYFSRAVGSVTDERESRLLLALFTRYDYLFQIHDSIEDIFNTKRVMNRQYIELESDVLLVVRELSSATLALFDDIHDALIQGSGPLPESKPHALMAALDEANRDLLPLLADTVRRDAGALTNFVTYSRRLSDKLLNFARLSAPAMHRQEPPDT